jgi:hypothetical protein
MFKKAEKKQLKARILIEGYSGSGKTYSSLVLATRIAELDGGRAAFIDTENRSSEIYANLFDFDVLCMPQSSSPERYIEAIRGAENAGYKAIVIDSVSHIWEWCLQEQSKLESAAGKSKSSFGTWRKITPIYERFIKSILTSSIHVICTVRSKADYQVTNDGGKSKIEKNGTKPIAREGLEYEFITVFSLNTDNIATATKNRTPLFQVPDRITPQFADDMHAFLNDGAPTADYKTEAQIAFSGCSTMDELKETWLSLPEEMKLNDAVIAEKELAKARLSAEGQYA